MKSQLFQRSLISIVVSFVLLGTCWSQPTTFIDSEIGLMNTCDPCGQLTPQQGVEQLKTEILGVLRMTAADVLSALIQAMEDYKVSSLSHPALNLEPCCGYSRFIESLDDMSSLNKAEMLSKVMLMLNDVNSIENFPSLDAAIIQNLNNTLCALRTVDNSLTVEPCLQLSPLDMCTRGNTCDAMITLSFLKDSFIFLRSLINEGI